MTDDRTFSSNEDWAKSIDRYKESKRQRNRAKSIELIEEFAVEIVKVKHAWFITFHTKFGFSDCVLNTLDFSWYRQKGKATGKGVESLFKYFKPIKKDGYHD